ncbi:hypothetical protein [Paracoccus zhejiangensis]|uniref:DUF3329 domain-containing protein n=1 Tax=Paracoccus zhejiangensis TaxID=1077935 RepID=A0A2H5F400_9RHOB|nr:hypothetical protein [Paracoccus zhejiangensis]AUH66273.1 hypothetical protein CX676_09865 [Paracoccus zhejiangensis]
MLVDPKAPFFRPLWVRILCVLLPLIWAGVEVSTGKIGWGLIFGAAGIYLLYVLFLSADKP